jgi:inorganic pyrophosphatase
VTPIPGDPRIGAVVAAVVEVPRGSFVKRELHDEARVDFVSPLPSPFNYGFVVDRAGDDGDPLDAVILGPRLALGQRVELPVVAVVRFVDCGRPDRKLVLSPSPLTAGQRRALRGFFRLYALAKVPLERLRGRRGRIAFEGLDEA